MSEETAKELLDAMSSLGKKIDTFNEYYADVAKCDLILKKRKLELEFKKEENDHFARLIGR